MPLLRIKSNTMNKLTKAVRGPGCTSETQRPVTQRSRRQELKVASPAARGQVTEAAIQKWAPKQTLGVTDVQDTLSHAGRHNSTCADRAGKLQISRNAHPPLLAFLSLPALLVGAVTARACSCGLVLLPQVHRPQPQPLAKRKWPWESKTFLFLW